MLCISARRYLFHCEPLALPFRRATSERLHGRHSNPDAPTATLIGQCARAGNPKPMISTAPDSLRGGEDRLHSFRVGGWSLRA